MKDRTCNRCNQPLNRGQAKFCSHACANRSTMSSIAARNREVGWKTCGIGGCEKSARSRSAELCPMHYHRMYRNGSLERLTVLPKWVDIQGQRFGTLTVRHRVANKWLCLCCCGRTRIVSTGELNRTGQANTCGTPGEHLRVDSGYGAAHERVARAQGSAKLHQCVGCGSPAQHWSYNHDDPDELHATGLSSKPVAYSLKTQHYSPRCVSCHKRFDLHRLDAAWTTSRHRNPYTAWGTPTPNQASEHRA